MEHVLSHPSPDAAVPLAFSLIRVPFFLEPSYAEDRPYVESNRDRLIRKWGGTEAWEEQKRRHNLKGRGLEAGIESFNLDRLASNTMASHRLIQHLGKTYGLAVSEAVYDVLNEYHFVQGHALNDRPRLAATVAQVLQRFLDSAPSEEDLMAFLNADDGRTEIERALAALNQLGIHSIPKFIIEGTTVVDGAAHADAFVPIFRQIEQRGFVRGGPVFGEILGISEDVVNQASHGREHI